MFIILGNILALHKTNHVDLKIQFSMECIANDVVISL